MPAQPVRADQAEFLLGELDKMYLAYAKIPQKPYLRADDKTALRHDLERALQRV